MGQFDLHNTSATVEPPDLADIVITQDGFMVEDAILVAFALHAIAHVIGSGSSVQMGRVDARRIIALMKHVKTAWDWTVRQFKGDSMCPVFVSSTNEGPVTMSFYSPSPQPTGGGFFDLSPKTNVVTLPPKSVITDARTIAPSFDVTRLSGKGRIAVATVNKYFTTSHDLSLHDRLGLWSGLADRFSGLSSRLNYNMGGAF